ncbi:MAG: uracil-DNA glycosylase [Acidimicrobiia bacterium]|nr:uracil-DNA glycosylase [Acidimicrobiia bacterium]MDQ3462380.1 uracil-DNA glycosylase [Actinomycetota bacterium]
MSDPSMAAIAAEAATCTRCRLAEGRTQVVFGMGNPEADLLFVGEGPGADEDAAGLPFVGRSGKLLDRMMAEEMGLTRADCYIANMVKCRPPGNRDPRPDEMATCRPWLDAQLAHLDPTVVVTLGNVATRTLLGRREGITQLRGRAYSWQGRVVIPTYHPSAALRGTVGALAGMRADLVRAKQALAGVTPASVAHQGAP